MTEEKHPRRDLSFTCDRRTFFRALLQEAFVIRGSIKEGGQGGRLSALGSMPDEQIAHVRPVVSDDCEILVDQGHVCARYRPKEQPPIRLFSVEEEGNLTAFNMFNGEHTLGEIGSRLAQEKAWDESVAFEHVRDLFLTLVERAVCHPKDPPKADA
jgi:hypothetical protein